MYDIPLFLVGILVGAINAVAGGGMLIGFPTLIASGMTPLIANATAKLVVLPGQITSAFGYRRFLRTMPRRDLLLIVPITVGAGIGALLLRGTPSKDFTFLAPILVTLAVLLFAFQPVIEKVLEHGRKKRVVLPFAAIAAILFASAIYAGYFGIGYGLIMLSILSFSELQSIHHMNMLKNLAAASMLAVVVLILSPGAFIDWVPGAVMAAGAAVGGYVTARLAPRVPTRALRIVIIAFGIVTIAYLLLHPNLF